MPEKKKGLYGTDLGMLCERVIQIYADWQHLKIDERDTDIGEELTEVVKLLKAANPSHPGWPKV